MLVKMRSAIVASCWSFGIHIESPETTGECRPMRRRSHAYLLCPRRKFNSFCGGGDSAPYAANSLRNLHCALRKPVRAHTIKSLLFPIDHCFFALSF